jgi:uncharacterized protein (TIGR03067 family)
MSAGVVAAQKTDKEAVEKELKQLQGTWKQVSIESNGQKEGFAKGMAPRFTIRGDRYTVEAGGKVLERGTLKVDPATKPRQSDLIVMDGASKVKTYPGIYEITGDELRTCFTRTGGNRPTEFTAGAESGRAVAVYRRVQPPK